MLCYISPFPAVSLYLKKMFVMLVSRGKDTIDVIIFYSKLSLLSPYLNSEVK